MMIQKIVRVHKKDSAFLYATLEALEGAASFSTLDTKESGQIFRDIKICISPQFLDEIESVIETLRKRFPILEMKEDEQI